MKSSLTQNWIVCRVCLKTPSESMQAIFDKSDEKDLTNMISECGGVPIEQFDHYPDKICAKCLKYLRVAYKFRVTCQRSHKHLSRLIAPVAVAVVAEKIEDNEETADITLELEDAEEIALKLEPDESMQDIKREFSDLDEEEVIDVYEPLDDGAEIFEEIETEYLDHAVSMLSGEIEYLEDIPAEEQKQEPVTSDEEFIPYAKMVARKNKNKPPKQKASTQKPSTSRKPFMIKSETPGKRGPKPKRPKETAYICDVCGNIYPSQGRLTEHMKLHKGIKPHECEICGHAFAQTQQLARHMNTHTGRRPYKCNYCPAAFADLSTRNKHHRIHTNERPYECDVCGKAFSYTNTLKFHKMIHTGEKPHVCDVCGKGFQQAYKLRNHKMTHEKKGIKVEKIEVETMQSYQEVNSAAAKIEVETMQGYQEVNSAAAQLLEI